MTKQSQFPKVKWSEIYDGKANQALEPPSSNIKLKYE